MAVWDPGTLSSVPGVLFTAVPESCVQSIGDITLEVKCAGARSAANPHATCEVAGAGDGVTETPRRARRGKPWIQTRRLLRATAPVLDPTEVRGSIRTNAWCPLFKECGHQEVLGKRKWLGKKGNWQDWRRGRDYRRPLPMSQKMTVNRVKRQR